MFADIIVDISHEKLDRTFQYLVPENLQKNIRIGSVVQIPFGRSNRATKGYVVGLSEQAQFDPGRTKEVGALLTDMAQLSGEDRLVALAAWMRDTYGSTMIQALRTVIPVRKRMEKRVQKSIALKMDSVQAKESLAIFCRKNQRARVRLLTALLEEQEIPYELVTGKLNISLATIRALEEQQILEIRSRSVYRNPLDAGKLSRQGERNVTLNEEQRRTVEGIWREWQETHRRVSLIYGVTGSGKTEVYMELIARTIEQGKQAIVLIPEIALTYQTVMRFYHRFGDRISIIHSRLSAGERYDQFERAARGEIDVMIGPRSALFIPFPRLGVIIMDEEHEPSYQSETMPRYHTREVAIRRAELEDARVILGSATPSLEAYSRALRGEYGLYKLERRARSSALPQVEITDMREELRRGNRSILSEELQKKMETALQKKRQIMLFLNRRGYSGFLSCRSCGHVICCPHCDVSLSVHRGSRLICHYCGHEEPRPSKCPSCGSELLSGFGIGTEQVEETVKTYFPQARVLRMDMDTTRKKDGHEKILSAFANHEADILIGTQMIVKGHDFPEVTLVGILAADISLHASDYRASERTFQLLTQAAGRAGRGEHAGEVVIQTYDPEHYAVQAAASQDYDRFYEEEISYRMLGGYPPDRQMLSVHGSCLQEIHLQTAMEYLRRFAQKISEKREIQIFGPAPESIAKLQDAYRMVLYLKARKRQSLIEMKNLLEKYIEINDGYKTVNIQFDMND
ncbi:MAG: primosomal protein N' [Eubacteriales bacterium]|nr:primosomal protein N' [Eubacteriales bacterium]